VRVASVALAVVAALMFGLSATLQQASARRARLRVLGDQPGGRRAWLPVFGVLGRLLHDRWWQVGWALNVSGFVAHAIALHLGSITVVQAILAVQLMFALSASTFLRRQRVLARDWSGAVAVCVGVILVVALRGDIPQSVPRSDQVVPAAAAATLLIGSLLTVARFVGSRTQARSALIAIGAGISFCTTAVFVVVVTDAIAMDGPASALGWPLAALVVSAVTGSLLVQDSFAHGSLPTALAAMTITDPVVSCVVGLALFDAVRAPGFGDLAGLAGAGVLIAVGVTVLANSPNLDTEPDPAGQTAPSLSA
jgi:drug/metabolite transporter (DMT)-like permease